MKLPRVILAVTVLLAAAVGAGCMSPEEDPADTVQEETTPGTTVAGGEPTGEPANETGVTAGEGETETVEETTEGDEATEGEETTEDEGEG